MTRELNLALMMPSSQGSSVQKILTIGALDMARNGHRVTIFVPLFPWFYYFVSLRKQPVLWLRYIIPNLRNLARQRKSHFWELLRGETAADRIIVTFVPMWVSRRKLAKFDYILVNSIDNVVGYRDRFDQHRQIYMVHHPEEHIHGYAEVFKSIRKSFNGKILVISPFTAREIGDHVASAPIVPNPVTPALWALRDNLDVTAPRRDILLFWKENVSGREGAAVIQELLLLSPDITFTVWCSGVGARAGAQAVLPDADFAENLSEKELGQLFLNHSFLIFPSRYEGFGMPPIEGMAGGCVPVLHPGVGAAELYAKDGENCLSLGAGPTVVARRIAELLKDSKSMQSLRRAAADSISQFNPNGYGMRLLEAAAIK